MIGSNYSDAIFAIPSKICSSNKLRLDLLAYQNGKCAICLIGPFCAACQLEIDQSDIEIETRISVNGRKHTYYLHKDFNDHKVQIVNTLDHNHIHKECKGCKVCARGMLHDRCNRHVIAMIERYPHLQNDFTSSYLNTYPLSLSK
jgi:hypothetical protein